jgi:hypothetical protein
MSFSLVTYQTPGGHMSFRSLQALTVVDEDTNNIEQYESAVLLRLRQQHVASADGREMSW